jgi:hypothetical protein
VVVVAAPGIARRAHAGQFVHVRAGERFDPLLRRPYSFLRIDRRSGEIELIVKPLGPGGIIEVDYFSWEELSGITERIVKDQEARNQSVGDQDDSVSSTG